MNMSIQSESSAIWICASDVAISMTPAFGNCSRNLRASPQSNPSSVFGRIPRLSSYAAMDMLILYPEFPKMRTNSGDFV